ncbi:MAG: fructosamine kinase family protein [Aggregatilineales bacterium]
MIDLFKQLLSGGMIGTVYRVDLHDTTMMVVKVMSGEVANLDIEGYMLQYLAEHSQLPVPEIFYSTKTLLLMTYIEGNSSLPATVQEDAAEHLANLHAISASHYGLKRDTLIGGLHQPNAQNQSWIAFFRDQRILYMARKALEEKQMPAEFYGRLEKFCDHLDHWISEPEQPSLIHGDMWTTNILAQQGKISGFVDPAIYYADPEIELAFSTLFGTFGRTFFARYNEIRPISAGFMDTRKDIYNLYPLLVHVRLFGAGYLSGIDQTLRRFGY